MLSIADIRDYISGFDITADDNVYMGKLDNKKDKSVGVYQRKTTGSPYIALGGYEASTYEIKPISILVHWNNSPRESEEAAFFLFEKLKTEINVTINSSYIDYIHLMVPEPQDVGTDDKGICEYVIWLDFIYEKKG